jgi:hypothetical protein
MPKYIPFTEAQKQATKQADLAVFLQSHGEQIKKSGSEYEWIGHHITLRGNQFYDQYQQKGGTAVDFVQEYFGLSYPEAVSQLIMENGELIMKDDVSHTNNYPLSTINYQFSLPPANENMRRVYAYLIKQRCIDRAVIHEFAHCGLLYEDAKYHNAVFVGCDKAGNPRHAHKKSTAIKDSSYRGNQSGSEAAFSFHWNGSSDTIYAFEAPIDMMSFITMYPENWQQDSYVSLCSVADKALFHQLAERPELQKVVLCLDNDEAGQIATQRITEKLIAAGYSDVAVMIPNAKDWNEELKQLIMENGELIMNDGDMHPNNYPLSIINYQLSIRKRG